jgi:CO/xanthine dehydrogenase FAD-binding subunit
VEWHGNYVANFWDSPLEPEPIARNLTNMKPPVFDYYAPQNLAEALALLEQFGSDARVLAGGQSLVPLMNMRLVTPQRIVDINKISELDYIKVRDDYLCLGALTRHRAIERSEVVGAQCPLLTRAVAFVGHAQVRTRGTIGGSVAHADPAAEYPAILAALDGEIVAQSRRGRRVIGWQEFFLAPYTVDLQPDEIVVEVRLRKPAQPAACAFVELSRRHGDFALVEAAVQLELDENGKCTRVNISLGGVGGAPVKAFTAQELLRGQAPDPRHLREAAFAAAKSIDPPDDLHASANYRKKMSSLLVARALEHAVRTGLASKQNPH